MLTQFAQNVDDCYEKIQRYKQKRILTKVLEKIAIFCPKIVKLVIITLAADLFNHRLF
jgi:hypothetical protein